MSLYLSLKMLSKDWYIFLGSLIYILPDIILKYNLKENEKHAICRKDFSHSSTMCNKLQHQSIKIITMQHNITASLLLYVMLIERQDHVLNINKIFLAE